MSDGQASVVVFFCCVKIHSVLEDIYKMWKKIRNGKEEEKK